MKTISFELSKKLNDLGLLDNIETEYYYDDKFIIHKGMVDIKNYKKLGLYKTLNLEEAIEFLPNSIKYGNTNTSLKMDKYNGEYTFYYSHSRSPRYNYGKTPLESIEKLIEYLLNNNLLGKK